MQALPNLVNYEGDEEVQYVLIDLPNTVRAEDLAPGAQVNLQDVDTECPKLQLGNGPVLQGTWTDHLGTVILFKHTQEAREGSKATQPACKLLGLSESHLVFKRVQTEAGRAAQLPSPTTNLLEGWNPNQSKQVVPGGGQDATGEAGEGG